MIPTEIVEMLDRADQVGVDTSVPPRFDCEKCNGKMVPIYWSEGTSLRIQTKLNFSTLKRVVFFHAQIFSICKLLLLTLG